MNISSEFLKYCQQMILVPFLFACDGEVCTCIHTNNERNHIPYSHSCFMGYILQQLTGEVSPSDCSLRSFSRWAGKEYISLSYHLQPYTIPPWWVNLAHEWFYQMRPKTRISVMNRVQLSPCRDVFGKTSLKTKLCKIFGSNVSYTFALRTICVFLRFQCWLASRMLQSKEKVV